MIRSLKHPCLIVASVLIAGCATVQRDAAFPGVASVVKERTGASIKWNQGSEADKEVEAHIHSLLQKELSVDDAVQVALLKNESLQATYEELGVAQAELVGAGLLRNPQFGAEVRFPKGAALPFELNLTQDFLDLLLLPARKRAAGAAFEATKLRVTNEVLTTAADVKAAFYRTQGAAQLVEMRKTVCEATEASFEVARRLHEAGNITDLNFANERSLLEQSKIDLSKAEAALLDTREELSAVMGVWGQDTTWSIATKLPDLPDEEMQQTGLESLAISQRADLAASRNDVILSGENLGLSRYNVLGNFNVGGHYEKDSDGTETVGPTIEFPLPIFNQGQPAAAAALSRLRQNQHRYAALAVEIRAQVRRARNKLIAARDRAQYYRKVIVPLRHNIVAQTQLQYNAMLVSVFQLLQAKQSEIDSGREYVEAVTDYWEVKTELERVVGGYFKKTGNETSSESEAAPANNHQH
jgi:cobalt-zinc-cadmium efflux system outer membrane protein